MPSNFEHRVHTGFDKREGRYVGLPLQWASIVGNNQILKSSNRPLPLVDPSEITPTEILDLKTIVRPHHNNNKADTTSLNSSNMTLTGSGGAGVAAMSLMAQINHGQDNGNGAAGGIILPKTSHVARSNSLRSSSPPRVRRDLRGNANVPPAVPEEYVAPMPGQFKQPLMMQPTRQLVQPGSQLHADGQVQDGSQMHAMQHLHHNHCGQQNGNVLPLAVRTDAAALHQQQRAASLQAQTSPVGSVASVTRSTHSHMSNAAAAGQQHLPHMHHGMYQQKHMTDQNQNPHHAAAAVAAAAQMQMKAASRASSSSGGNASAAGAAPAKQEQRLTHEQVNIHVLSATQ